MDLFGDLPEPTQVTVKEFMPSQPSEETNRGEKRKHNEGLEKEVTEEKNEEEKKVCKGYARLKGYVAARRGEREDMQDAHILLPDMSSVISSLPPQVSRLAYFAVFDGHGGARASQFAAEHLHHILVAKFPKGDGENLDKLIKKCLLDTFRQTDEDFLKKASSQLSQVYFLYCCHRGRFQSAHLSLEQFIKGGGRKPAWKDGSTATCVLVVDNVLYVANLGDSRAVLCRSECGENGEARKCVTLALSKEHNPTIYEERMRIQRAGGTVRDGRVLGVLEVSRSIGDGQYKRCGVISTPDLRRCQLTGSDRFVILACDGLFKVFSPEEAVKYVLNILEDASVAVEKKENQTEGEARHDTACQRLAGEAVRRGCADNVTVILVSIEF